MAIQHVIPLVLFLVLMAALFLRYVHAEVDGEFRRLARAASDKEFRDGELRRVNELLAKSLPLPPDVAPVPKPAAAGVRILLPVLLAVGVILLWGSLFSREERDLWLYAGAGCCLSAGAIALATLRRRKRERLARLLRFRADLRRLGGDSSMAAADLAELLRLTPWDDAAWAELSDDLDAAGDMDGALEAIGRAAGLDPGYDEYRMLEASLSLRLGKPERARSAVNAWAELDGTAPDDPRLAIYRAAVELAEGKREKAVESFRRALAVPDSPEDLPDADRALWAIRDLSLSGGGRKEST